MSNNLFNIPTLTEIVNRMRADVRQENPNLDPTIRRSWARAFTDALAVRIFGAYLALLQLIDQMFPQTATGAYLARWGDYSDLSKGAAEIATGTVIFAATPATSVPDATLFTSDGLTYASVGAVVAGTQVNIITSLTRSGTTVTAVTSGAHNLASNLSPTISGAIETEYNGTFPVAVLDEFTFTYEIAGTPTSPATTATDILVTLASAIVPVQSQDATADANRPSGAPFELSGAPIAGLTSPGYSDTNQVTGGADAQTDDEFRADILDDRANPPANYNEASVIETVKQASTAVTRVFINKYTPLPGQAEVFPIYDEQSPITPTGDQITDVKNSILDTIYPAHADPDDLFVLEAALVPTNFVFSSLVPNTQTMRDAITSSLVAFFQDEVAFQTTVVAEKYEAAISTTIDATGATVTAFSLSSPGGDINIAGAPSGELATLGTVTY